MHVPAWKLMTLPRVRMDLPQWAKKSSTFHNLDTTVHNDDVGPKMRHGQVMWGTSWADSVAGIAWDWREVQANVVAMCDPMAVQSNLELVDAGDQTLTAEQQLLYLNRVIHSLPWQEHVCAVWRRQPAFRHAA